MRDSWKRLIRSVKTALSVILNERSPKEETLLTLLIEVEDIINSRPLTHVSVNHVDEKSITPNHFLIESSSAVPTPGSFTNADLHFKKQWTIAQRLADMSWSRLVKTYICLILLSKNSGTKRWDQCRRVTLC